MPYFDDIQFLAGDVLPTCGAVLDQRFEGMYSVEFMLSGRLSFGIDGRPAVIVSEPVLFWHHPRHSYQYGAVDGTGWHHHYVTFRGDRGRRLAETGFMVLSDTGYLPITDAEPMAALFRGLVHLVNHALPRRQADAVVLLERILATAITESRGAGRPSRGASLIAIAEEIEANPGSEVHFERIAQRLGMSYSHFRRRFRLETGHAPQAFLNQSRLRRAAILLRSSHLRIQEIAAETGYDDPAGFARTFRKKYGMSPRSYRAATRLD